LITAHLLRGEYSTSLSYLEDFLANVEFYRGKIPVPLQPTLDAMKKVLVAYETHNYNLVETTITELRRHFESLRKEGRLAIDTASLITDWDILAILENIPNQIHPKEDDYQN
jgi:hypothetical protein